jgi:hypothetical protein
MIRDKKEASKIHQPKTWFSQFRSHVPVVYTLVLMYTTGTDGFSLSCSHVPVVYILVLKCNPRVHESGIGMTTVLGWCTKGDQFLVCCFSSTYIYGFLFVQIIYFINQDM